MKQEISLPDDGKPIGPIEQTLRDAWELIADVDNRCSDAIAKTSDGRDVLPNDPEACQWCGIGAYNKILSPEADYDFDVYCLMLDAANRLGFSTIVLIFQLDIVNNPPKLYEKAIHLAHERGV